MAAPVLKLVSEITAAEQEIREVEAQMALSSNGHRSGDVLPPLDGLRQYAYTDTGNGERFRDRHGENVRYVFGSDSWFIWDGMKWAEDNGDQIQRLAKETVLSIFDEPCSEEKFRNKHALDSQSTGGRNSTLKCAQSEDSIPVTFDIFDANQFYLNVKNGTIDLTTGQMHSHRREDYNTKMIPVEYHPHAECPVFENFLDRSQKGNYENIEYIQRAVGYSATGATHEKCLFFLHGKTDTGKTIFLEALRYVFGDYGVTTPSETLAAKQNRSGKIPNDIARLHGARLVLASEGEQGDYLHEGLVKQFTGGDTVVARFLNKEFFEFRPSGKFWFGTNHLPRFHGGDSAIERRVRLIPFNVQIPRNEQVADLGELLKLEAEGILNWIVKGCLKWRREGLHTPADIQKATAKLIADNDDIQQFIFECCVTYSDYDVSRPALYDAYKTWCERGKRTALNDKNFKSVIESRGFFTDDVRKRFVTLGNAQYFWRGIKLNEN